jgi:hypothetical protein
MVLANPGDERFGIIRSTDSSRNRQSVDKYLDWNGWRNNDLCREHFINHSLYTSE